jgi:hypothetical protein
MVHERQGGINQDVSGQEEEGDPDKKLGTSVGISGFLEWSVRANFEESPEDDQGGRDFDQAVDSKGD